MENITLVQLYEKHVRDTSAEALVANVTIFLCHLTFAVTESVSFQSPKVNLSTRVLKHLYDKRPAEEFSFILRHMTKIVRYPDSVYINLDTKKGDLAFVKKIKGNNYLCSIQKDVGHDSEPNVEVVNYVVTCFRLRKKNYLNGYRLLWSWKDGDPSS